KIANDALDLSMRIKENIAFDSAGEALKEYAAIEMLLFQHKTEEALTRIAALKKGEVSKKLQDRDTTFAITNQTILDDVYWLEANIRLEEGSFDQSLSLLQKIQTEYGQDILADDALFLQAEIYERHLNDKEKAMETYRNFLTAFPGSVFAAEARKRFRSLRGDFSGQEQPQF